MFCRFFSAAKILVLTNFVLIASAVPFHDVRATDEQVIVISTEVDSSLEDRMAAGKTNLTGRVFLGDLRVGNHAEKLYTQRYRPESSSRGVYVKRKSFSTPALQENRLYQFAIENSAELLNLLFFSPLLS